MFHWYDLGPKNLLLSDSPQTGAVVQSISNCILFHTLLELETNLIHFTFDIGVTDDVEFLSKKCFFLTEKKMYLSKKIYAHVKGINLKTVKVHFFTVNIFKYTPGKLRCQ